MGKTNWFHRHLNWTMTIVGYGPLLPVIIVYCITHSDIFLGIYLTAWALAIMVTSGWVLVQKGRSLGYLAYLIIIPWGPLKIISLDNLKEW